MRSPDRGGAIPLAHALALGLLQGPTELLPVSSSAHTELLPWLARWPYGRLDGERRRSFEVALHVGAGAALAIHMRRELAGEVRRMDRRRARVVALSLAPAALAGYALERPIERRLPLRGRIVIGDGCGGPRSIAAGLVAGSVAMALADGRASRRERARVDGGRAGGRGAEDARASDGLALGIAQAAALAPGVSRSGATLAAARWRGFDRAAAQGLSWHAGLPVLLGAGALKAARLLRTAPSRHERAALAVGGASAFVSTLASARALDRHLRAGHSLLAWSLYRCALAALVLARVNARPPAERTGS